MTIKELSHLTGYSVSTVSKALNNKGDISFRTRESISKVAKKHNYRPNRMAISLRMKQNKTVAVALPCLTLYCFSEALHYIQKYADGRGYKVIFYQYGLNQQLLDPFLKFLDTSMIEGLLLLTDDLDVILPSLEVPVVVEQFQEMEFTNFIKWKSKEAFLDLEKQL